MAKCHPDHETNSVCSFIRERAGLSDKLLCLICWGFSLPALHIPGREAAITESSVLGQLDTSSPGKEGTQFTDPPGAGSGPLPAPFFFFSSGLKTNLEETIFALLGAQDFVFSAAPVSPHVRAYIYIAQNQ